MPVSSVLGYVLVTLSNRRFSSRTTTLRSETVFRTGFRDAMGNSNITTFLKLNISKYVRISYPKILYKTVRCMSQTGRVHVKRIYNLFRICDPQSYQKINVLVNIFEINFLICFLELPEQSKLTRSHLCGLKLNESANSTPFIKWRNSSQIKAEPA